MFPENIVQASFQQVQTKYIEVKPKILKKNTTELQLAISNGSMSILKPTVEYTAGMNVLGWSFYLKIIFSSIVDKFSQSF